MEEMSDALQAASNVSKLLMENDRVRVFDAHFKPGEKAAMHMRINLNDISNSPDMRYFL